MKGSMIKGKVSPASLLSLRPLIRPNVQYPQHYEGENVTAVMKDSALCIRCKGGKRLCGKERCPYLKKLNSFSSSTEISGTSFWGSSPPSIFVGRYGYPKVNIGPVLPPVRAFKPERLEESRYWHDMNIEDIITMRSSLYRMKKEVKIKNSYEPRSRFLADTQELALSAKSIDTEIHVRSIPKIRKITKFDTFSPPLGPSVDVERIELGENPRVPKKLDYLTSDIHASAVTAIDELFQANISVNHIQRTLSAGLLGRARARRLVPTRWSITAVDDNVGKRLAEEIKKYPEIGEIYYHHYTHFGNTFHVLLLPGVYSFELLEAWLKGAFWSEATTIVSDFEGYGGRKDYASNTTGGYYAARISALSHLARTRRQAKILIYREISDEYWAPLGVWVVRDGVEGTMKQKGKRFSELGSALSAVSGSTRVKEWWKHSRLLKEIRVQKKIDDF